MNGCWEVVASRLYRHEPGPGHDTWDAGKDMGGQVKSWFVSRCLSESAYRNKPLPGLFYDIKRFAAGDFVQIGV